MGSCLYESANRVFNVLINETVGLKCFEYFRGFDPLSLSPRKEREQNEILGVDFDIGTELGPKNGILKLDVVLN